MSTLKGQDEVVSHFFVEPPFVHVNEPRCWAGGSFALTTITFICGCAIFVRRAVSGEIRGTRLVTGMGRGARRRGGGQEGASVATGDGWKKIAMQGQICVRGENTTSK